MDQQFSLSWNNFHGNLSKGFAGLLGQAEFVDVTLAVEGHLLQAHKVILSICSPYFKKMFQLNPCQHPIVVLRDVTYKAMKDLLLFMYQGEVSVKREELTNFIGTAELLQIKGLTNKDTEEISEENHQQNHNKNIPLQENTEPKQINNDITHNDYAKQCEIIQRLQKLTSLKRKSEEFLQKNYFSTDILVNNDKRLKTKEISKPNNVSNSNFDHFQAYDEHPIDATIDYSNNRRKSREMDSRSGSLTPEGNVDVKAEVDDGDIVVTDPAVCRTPQGYESRDRHKAADFSMVQDSALALVINEPSDQHQLPVPYKYIYSRKGHKQLVHRNFVYTKHSTSHGKTSWRCVQYFSLNRCPATIETVDEMIFAVNHEHNHDDSYDKLSKDLIYECTSFDSKQ